MAALSDNRIEPLTQTQTDITTKDWHFTVKSSTKVAVNCTFKVAGVASRRGSGVCLRPMDYLQSAEPAANIPNDIQHHTTLKAHRCKDGFKRKQTIQYTQQWASDGE